MSDKIHTRHNFQSVVTKRQDIVKRYLTDGKYAVDKLEQDVVSIFCIICGEAKTIYEKQGFVDDEKD